METGGKRRLFSLVIFLSIYSPLLVANLSSPNAASPDLNLYYYSSGCKNALILSKEKLAVRFKQGLTVEEQRAVVESEPALGSFSQRQESPTFRLVILLLREGLTDEAVIQELERLNSRPEVEGAFPIFVLPDSEILLTDEFIVKFAANVSKAEIDAFNVSNGVEIVRKLKWIEHYVLRVKDATDMKTLKAANLYYENAITIFSVPNFIGRTEKLPTIPDDEYFSEQWPLHNFGQTGGTADADIDAPEGWDISTGSSDILIAVLDSGVDLAHEDLVSNLVPGYDAFAVPPDNDPSPGADWPNAHGTACAGLAAAQTNNAIGISGVGWNCMLMPIRVFHCDLVGEEQVWSYPRDRLEDGITWAANNGADVLSCSWPELEDNDAIHDAIIHAKNNGREGKGCVLVFAAHNYNRLLTYPSKYSEVIAVGATDHNDVRWNIRPGSGSNFGPELDVVAPSGWGSQQEVIMWTTDISDSAGYNPGNTDDGDANGHYYKWFGGTSAATPEVAGLAGLILSVNPELTADEAQFIIEDTADDQIGDPLEDTEGWDQYYGWGRINVYAALIEAQQFPTDDALVGWWKFDETSGDTASDSSGYGNDGTLADSPYDPAWVNDPERGRCLDFDVDVGEIDSVSLSPIGALATDTVTISAWIKADDLSDDDHSILIQYNTRHEGYYFYVDNDRRPALWLEGSQAKSPDEIDPGKWYHLAGTYDGSDLKIYVDGVEKGTQDLPGEKGINYYPYIGWNFDGKINDVRVYNYTLDMFEIWDAMSGELPRFRIKNSSDETVAWFDSFGNLFLKGSKYTGAGWKEPSGTNDEFIVEDGSGPIVYIDELGDLYLREGDVIEKTTPTLSGNDFRIQDSSGDVAVINTSDGKVYLKGELYQNPE